MYQISLRTFTRDGNFRAALKEEIDREMTRLLATPNAGESNNGEKPDRGN